jgi:bacillithiol system protein YtxJ
MNWIKLTNEDQLQHIIERSAETPQVIFKFSSRCSISNVAMQRLEKKKAPSDVEFYFLDILNYRDLSNRIAEEFNIQHESPQVLLIRNAQCIYDESHLSISMDEITVHTMVA